MRIRYDKYINFKTFSCERFKMSWLTYSRPHLCRLVKRASQVTEIIFYDIVADESNKASKWAILLNALHVKYHPMMFKELTIKHFAESCFSACRTYLVYLNTLTSNAIRATVRKSYTTQSKIWRELLNQRWLMNYRTSAIDLIYSMSCKKNLFKMVRTKISNHSVTLPRHSFDEISKVRQLLQSCICKVRLGGSSLG